MAIFIKLLAIRIVASSFWGFSISRKISLFFFVLLSFNSLSCFGVREKKATSEPEINADENSNKIIAIIPAKNPKETDFTIMVNVEIYRNGSGSKIYRLSF